MPVVHRGRTVTAVVVSFDTAIPDILVLSAVCKSVCADSVPVMVPHAVAVPLLEGVYMIGGGARFRS